MLRTETTVMQQQFKHITTQDIEALSAIVGAGSVFTEADHLEQFSRDYTENLKFLPQVVVKPASAEVVAQVLTYCNEHNIAVTPAGARTGLSGGALPVFGGVSLSTEKLNRILKIDADNFQVTVEPGIINQVLQQALSEQGLFYPPDPSSWGSCTIGGNIAHNAGGPKAVKYGVTRDYVLNLEVALPSGDLIWTGANVLKNATGYSLTHLVIGSEGTLGIVTKAVLKVIPAVKHQILMLVAFKNAVEACKAVPEIFKKGIQPSGLEFMERDAITYTLPYVDAFNVPLQEDDEAHLIIELDGNDLDKLYEQAQQVGELLGQYKTGEVFFADTAEQKQMLWKLRRKVGEAVKQHSIYKEEDTVVPRFQMAELLAYVKELGAVYGFKSVCYGHVGDGNLHVNILKADMSEQQWNEELPKAIASLFEKCRALGGTISGEHGIGYVQKQYINIVASATHINLFKAIKSAFDPKGILNPGKIWI